MSKKVKTVTRADWIWNEDEECYICSRCGYKEEPSRIDNVFNYCPVCGAKTSTESKGK